MQKKTAMDYYHHYQSFVRALRANPNLRLQAYCESNEVAWRRLYDWMRRNHISLKRLYREYGNSIDQEECRFAAAVPAGMPEFVEVRPSGTCVSGVHGMSVARVRMTLPSGVTVDMSQCPVEALSMLVEQCMGKEVADVRP